MKTSPKIEKILDVALALLKSQGDYGVTMRQVASHADMSLSNVQYYFKNKDELLKAMADRYFSQCLEDIRNIKGLQGPHSMQDEVAGILEAFLSHGVEISDMCRIFREYWAISTRNEVINTYVLDYYQEMASILMEKLQPVAQSKKGAAEAVSLIIPYMEGYSITGLSLPENIERVTELLTSIIIRILKEK